MYYSSDLIDSLTDLWNVAHGGSHLQGMFNRTIRVLEAGLKPVYVNPLLSMLRPVVRYISIMSLFFLSFRCHCEGFINSISRRKSLECTLCAVTFSTGSHRI